MKIWEVLRLAVEENKKIRLATWPDNDYVFFQDGRFVGRDGQPSWVGKDFNIPIDCWEIYVPWQEFKTLSDCSKFKVSIDGPVYMKIPEFCGKNSVCINHKIYFHNPYDKVIPV